MSKPRCRIRLGARTRMGTSPRARSGLRTTPAFGTPPAPPAETFFLLLETGDRVLLETDDKILLENAP